MSDNVNISMCDSNDVKNDCSNAVCIDAMRVYDSCSDKDCINDLRVFFTEEVQALVDDSVNVRLRDAEVLTVTTNLEPVPFNKGFYSVDITFFFSVTLDLYSSAGAAPTQVQGTAMFNKKVILFGSDGNVKVFSTEYGSDPAEAQTLSLPRVNVQVAKPIALSAKIGSCSSLNRFPCSVPQCVCNCVGGEPTDDGTRCVTVTLGLFSIVQIERNVQLLVHSYDFCIPKKECTNSTDNPCEVFSRLDFPKDQFFPPNICDSKTGSCGCGCN